MANQAIYAPFRVLDANGDPVAGALAAFYVSGTTTPIDVFSDAAGLVPAANPVEADGDGYLPQRYFDGAAKVVITDALGATLRTIDPCPISIISGAAAGQTTFDPTPEIPVANVQDAIVAVDDNARTREESLQPLDATLTSLSGLSLVQGDILYATAADTLARLAKGTAGQVLRMNAGATAPEWVSQGVGIVTAEYSSGVSGAAYPTGSFAALELTTERSDSSLSISVGSNRITFANAGTYLIRAVNVAYNGSGSGRQAQLRLYNVTTAAAAGIGQVTSSATATPMTLEVVNVLTLTAATVLEVQGIASGANVLQCSAGSFGAEVGTTVTITRIA